MSIAPAPASVAGPISERLDALREVLRGFDRVAVAFSGGADSALLAYVAHETLGDRAVAVTAVSPSLAGSEAEACRSLSAEWGLRWSTVETREMENAAYRRNDGDRCFWCKDALLDALEGSGLAAGAAILLGVNVDDLGDHRPGQQAAAQRGARFPLVETGFTKADVRAASAALGLRTWDKPAAACLASRLPYGTPVTLGRLRDVDQAEEALRGLGFAALRVRHYGDTARIEVPEADLARVVELRAAVVAAVLATGFRYVTLDLQGLRSGNLNQALADPR